MARTQDDLGQEVWLDKLAIREVLERFMRCDDDRAIDQMMELFDEAAVFQAGDGEHVGRAAIRAFISRSLAPIHRTGRLRVSSVGNPRRPICA